MFLLRVLSLLVLLQVQYCFISKCCRILPNHEKFRLFRKFFKAMTNRIGTIRRKMMYWFGSRSFKHLVDFFLHRKSAKRHLLFLDVVRCSHLDSFIEQLLLCKMLSPQTSCSPSLASPVLFSHVTHVIVEPRSCERCFNFRLSRECVTLVFFISASLPL